MNARLYLVSWSANGRREATLICADNSDVAYWQARSNGAVGTIAVELASWTDGLITDDYLDGAIATEEAFRPAFYC